MTCMHLVGSVTLATAVAGSGCARHDGATVPWDVKFGPVLGNELIVGHVVDGLRD